MFRDKLAQKHFERGRGFELQDRVDDAVEAYRQAVALEPEIPEPYFALGRIEACRGRCDVALPALERAVNLAEDHHGTLEVEEALEWRAYVHGRMRHYEDALADYQRVIDSGVSDPVVRVNAGRMLLAMRRYDEAELVLRESEDPSADVLIAALPRYREFDGRDPTDDERANRYLFGGTLVIGTLGDGGLPVAPIRYLLLTARHVAVTLVRFLRLAERSGWRFDGVVGEGRQNAPVAAALSSILGVPRLAAPKAGARVLMTTVVVPKVEDAVAARRPWLEAGARVMHLALGLAPDAEPDAGEPDVVGIVGRCAPYWYRVEPYTRLTPVEEGSGDAGEEQWPGFRLGPAYVNPNEAEVAGELVRAVVEAPADPFADPVLEYFTARHPQARALRWNADAAD